MRKLMIYNHGKDSVPWGEKTQAFAVVAKRYGYAVESPDYRHQPDPDLRVEQLLAMDFSDFEKIVLLGSSMGAYVATVASEILMPQGLFLLAPAFYLPGYRRSEFNLPTTRVRVYHGWQDDVVPPENAWRFCRNYHLALTMFDDGHRLMRVLPQLVGEFENFLRELEIGV